MGHQLVMQIALLMNVLQLNKPVMRYQANVHPQYENLIEDTECQNVQLDMKPALVNCFTSVEHCI